jgi:FAD:protein FMN transferase
MHLTKHNRQNISERGTVSVSTLHTKAHVRSFLQLGTVIHLKIITKASDARVDDAIKQVIERIKQVETVCSRFEETSELRQTSHHVGKPIVVSDILFEPLQFALEIAEMTNGVFDPTVGRVLHRQGFRKHYLTGHPVSDDEAEPGEVSFRDVTLNSSERTVLLHKPLTLDLGAVAKGFAVDLAVHELQEFEGFVIDAGGDVYVGGTNEFGEDWRVGIRHPIKTNEILCTLRASNVAICTSGGYERKNPTNPGAHHLINPRNGESLREVLSSTVIAPYAMMADAFSTVSFLMGCQPGAKFLQDVGGSGLLVDESLNLHFAGNMEEYLNG